MGELRDASLYKECIEIATEVYKNKFRNTGEKWIEQPRRMAQKAILLGWPDYVVATCWLHDAYEANPIDFDGVVEKVKLFSKKTAFFLEKCPYRQWESWGDYINRISASPEMRGVKWLEFLDELSFCDNKETIQKMLESLERLIPEYFIEKD